MSGSCRCGMVRSRCYTCRHLFKAVPQLNLYNISKDWFNPRWIKVDLNISTSSEDCQQSDRQPSLPSLESLEEELQVDTGSQGVAVEAYHYISRDLAFQVLKVRVVGVGRRARSSQ